MSLPGSSWAHLVWGMWGGPAQTAVLLFKKDQTHEYRRKADMTTNIQFISLRKSYILTPPFSSGWRSYLAYHSTNKSHLGVWVNSSVIFFFSPKAKSTRRSQRQNVKKRNCHCTEPHMSLHNQMSYNKDNLELLPWRWGHHWPDLSSHVTIWTTEAQSPVMFSKAWTKTDR